MTEMSDPLEPLRAAHVPDEIVRPLAELLIVDELVGSGRAERVTTFKLGASVGGSRPTHSIRRRLPSRRSRVRRSDILLDRRLRVISSCCSSSRRKA